MDVEYYNVYMGEECMAKDMSLDTAIILVKGLFHTYYNEPMPRIYIERQWRPMTKEEVEKWD